MTYIVIDNFLKDFENIRNHLYNTLNSAGQHRNMYFWCDYPTPTNTNPLPCDMWDQILNKIKSYYDMSECVGYEVWTQNQSLVNNGNYHLDNMYGCDCTLEKARNVQLSQPNVNFNGGKGWMGEDGCTIDTDSKLRIGEEGSDKLTNKNYIHQYPNLLNQGFFGKGVFDVDTETLIRDADMTTEQRPCNALSGASNLPYSFTPMISKLESEVQDPKNIIPEDSFSPTTWIGCSWVFT